jgi:lysozyme family protein
MAKSNYDECLRRVLRHEGGYTNHPSDPGGPTNFGITIHDYRKYVKPDATAADVRTMRLDEARRIYRTKYWDALRCNRLPPGLDYAVFDYGVNSGVGRSGKVLRRVLRLSDKSHAVTDGVIAAMKEHTTADLVAAICDERIAFLRRLKTWPVFGAGWGRRVAEVRAAALAMARRGPQSPAPETSSSGTGVPPHNAKAQQATAGGIAAAGCVAAHQAHHGGARPAIVAAIASAAIVAACAAWWWWSRRTKRQQEG